MTLVHVQRLFRYWGRRPPAHELLAARYGLKDPGPPGKPGMFSDADLAVIESLSSRVGLA
jgi:hypothetical protein